MVSCQSVGPCAVRFHRDMWWGLLLLHHLFGSFGYFCLRPSCGSLGGARSPKTPRSCVQLIVFLAVQSFVGIFYAIEVFCWDLFRVYIMNLMMFNVFRRGLLELVTARLACSSQCTFAMLLSCLWTGHWTCGRNLASNMLLGGQHWQRGQSP